MSKISLVEKKSLEGLFNTNSGELLNLTKKEFESLVTDSCNVDIKESKYLINGTSKAKVFFTFIEIEDDHLVSKLINELLKYSDQQGLFPVIIGNSKEVVIELMTRLMKSEIIKNEPKNKILGINDLHKNLKPECLDLFNNNHYTAAVQQAGKVVESKINNLKKEYSIQSNLTGHPLITRLFNTSNDNKKIVNLNYLSSSTEINEQVGFYYLIAGFNSAFRNTTSHPDYHVHNEVECLKILFLADLILSKIDNRPSLKNFTYLDYLSKLNLKSPWYDVFGELIGNIRKLGLDYGGMHNINEKINSTNIAYQINNKNFCEIVVNKNGTNIKVYLDVPINSLTDLQKKCVDKSKVGRGGTGMTLYNITDPKYDLDYLIQLINQSINYNKK
jgi:uncharacterized protein (TIGR02391 family)